jgi:hypothetical protein
MTAIRKVFLPDWQYTVNLAETNQCAVAALLQKSPGPADFPPPVRDLLRCELGQNVLARR